ncbi:phosphate permease [Annulohypoxylon truncatum]|uniref:phosphate permease n=1 Tax=Annulohypoxylon truncatum TaxID=327061 RepID=UPI0020073948|nr:phosphate permease [Annulohypoxylon truncatum]KAI1210826.1 phosphate permease [Annulohypoxylon truncatum]
MPTPEPMTPATYDRTYGGNRAFHNFFNDFSHIQDPNLRRRLALSEIDKVPFGMYHVRAVLVAGIGFFLDSYDIFAINLVTTLLGVVFWHGPPSNARDGYGGNYGRLPTPVSQALKASTSAGIIIGQVLFGWMADRFGRRRMYGVELGIIVFSTMSCCLVAASQSVSFTGLMTFWRVMMGIGIGGDYPLSAVITSEFAPTRWRGAMMAAVFSMQGMGQLLAAVVALIVTASFKDAFHNAPGVDECDYTCQIAADRCWRIIVGVGALPACFALYYRITIPETPRYTFEVAKDVEKAAADIKAYMASEGEGEVDEVMQARMKKVAAPALNIPSASWHDLYRYFKQWKNAKVLMGTTLSWFFLDLAFYGLGLNNQIVLRAIGYADGDSLYHILYNSAVGTIILVVAGSLPGYWTAIFTIDSIGRKPLQIIGFVILTITFCVLGFLYNSLSKGALLALYVIANYFFNFGPNTTTFIVPGECFPTRYRSSGHGLSAAMGKVGAIVAQVISLPLLTKDAPSPCSGKECTPWLDRLMQIFALFMLCGTLSSLLIPETKGYTLEELAGEPPTSYNSGRNGSFMETPAKSRWWNPFSGGRPAGFFYPRVATNGRVRSRTGIMSTPEFMAQNSEMANRGWMFWKRDRNRLGTATATDCGASSSSTAGFAGSGDTVVASAGVLPGWGAGWGRIDRGGNPLAMDNIRLQDVGSLLK